jgi:hypothetical protein
MIQYDLMSRVSNDSLSLSCVKLHFIETVQHIVLCCLTRRCPPFAVDAAVEEDESGEEEAAAPPSTDDVLPARWGRGPSRGGSGIAGGGADSDGPRGGGTVVGVGRAEKASAIAAAATATAMAKAKAARAAHCALGKIRADGNLIYTPTIRWLLGCNYGQSVQLSILECRCAMCDHGQTRSNHKSMMGFSNWLPP